MCKSQLAPQVTTMMPEVERILARRITPGRFEDVEDARQSVALSLLSVDRPVADPERYVRRSARLKAVDLWRSASTEARRRAPATDDVDRCPAPAFDPEEALLAKQRSRALALALEALSAEERSLVTGVYVDGDPMREVAARTGLPIRTAWRRLGHAFDGLRATLQPVY